MIMVAVGTFDWSSIPMLTKMPKSDAFVLLVTVATVVYTHDLAMGVFAGILLSAVFFASKLAWHIDVQAEESADGQVRVYRVRGPLFFVSVDNFLASFDYDIDAPNVTLDLSGASLWDSSAIGAVDKVVLKLRDNGIDVDVVAPAGQGSELMHKLARYDRSGAEKGGH